MSSWLQGAHNEQKWQSSNQVTKQSEVSSDLQKFSTSIHLNNEKVAPCALAASCALAADQMIQTKTKSCHATLRKLMSPALKTSQHAGQCYSTVVLHDIFNGRINRHPPLRPCQCRSRSCAIPFQQTILKQAMKEFAQGTSPERAKGRRH